MKCVICNSQDIATKPVFEEISRDDDIIRVPIQTLVCANCGERYYDRLTMRRLEEIRKHVAQGEVDLREVGKVLICEN